VYLIGLSLALGIVFGPIVAGQATAVAAESLRPLKVAWSLYPGYAPFVIAFKNDLITKHGGSVLPVLYDVSAKQLPDFEAEKLDGGFFAFADALTLAARSPGKARLVMVADNSDGADVIVAAPTVTRVADLKGKRIGTGIGSFRELLVRRMLEAHGLSVNDVVLVNMGPEDVPDAIPDSIQAGQTWDPFAALAIAKDGHVIFSSSQTPGLIPDVLVFRTKVIQQRPRDVRAVVNAWFDALDFWRAHPSEGNAIIASATGRSPEDVSTEGIKLLNRAENLRAFTVHKDSTSLFKSAQVNAEFLLSTGVLNKPPNVEEFLDPSFLK
jgi:NitT/TauT family transport system substrate-binding protein